MSEPLTPEPQANVDWWYAERERKLAMWEAMQAEEYSPRIQQIIDRVRTWTLPVPDTRATRQGAP